MERLYEDRYPTDGMTITAEPGSIVYRLKAKVPILMSRQTKPPAYVRVTRTLIIRASDNGECVMSILDPPEVS
jgi:hypothetical protein